MQICRRIRWNSINAFKFEFESGATTSHITVLKVQDLIKYRFVSGGVRVLIHSQQNVARYVLYEIVVNCYSLQIKFIHSNISAELQKDWPNNKTQTN